MSIEYSQDRSPSPTSQKQCWVCYNTDMDDMSAAWVRPCKCRGTTKWVHRHCLERWIDEKQGFDSSIKVSCRVCNSEYIIVYPPPGLFLRAMDLLNVGINMTCPIVVGGMVVGSVYWTAVTYGAITITQVYGHKEGLNLMEKADPLTLFMFLPAVPVVLVLCKMFTWDEILFRLWIKYSPKVTLLQALLPRAEMTPLRHQSNQDYPLSMANYSVPRILCGALVLPTVATIIGKMIFPRIQSSVKKTLMGGCLFVFIKGILRILHSVQKYNYSCRRNVKDYVETNSSLSS